jgi:23S rRNA (adenine2030-N6)-methyltransferase
VPPKQRRGLVLIDPPFEQPGEFARLADRLAAAYRKWATGLYLLWYPIKDRHECENFARRLAGSGIGKILRAELTIDDRADRLAGAGLVLVNPPWTLEGELALLLTALAAILAPGGAGGSRLDWLSREK